ncbi:MAG: hypothetical protein OXC82_02690 [Rhodobacteraceae bacterium]|nr:hypothetical protein [Paracoccaceae bacterium]MCY4249331.1 hypothetical protein [Paracoccaceae bacterium]MCY4309090.1 hypothetical protein [Paracoccaceae bacterium]
MAGIQTSPRGEQTHETIVEQTTIFSILAIALLLPALTGVSVEQQPEVWLYKDDSWGWN